MDVSLFSSIFKTRNETVMAVYISLIFIEMQFNLECCMGLVLYIKGRAKNTFSLGGIGVKTDV